MDNGATVETLWICFRTKGRLTDFRRLFDNCYAPLCRYADLILRDRMDAEEVVLDLFLYLWRNREKVNIDISIEQYLFRSVKNRSLNILRNRKGEAVPLDDRALFCVPPSLYVVEEEDISAIVRSAILSLPPKCREVFSKSRIDGMTNKEIASDMGISVKSVEAHITRALKKIKVRLKKFYLLLLFSF